jgi:hypothetical protein
MFALYSFAVLVATVATGGGWLIMQPTLRG